MWNHLMWLIENFTSNKVFNVWFNLQVLVYNKQVGPLKIEIDFSWFAQSSWSWFHVILHVSANQRRRKVEK